MSESSIAFFISLGLLLGMLAAIEFGRRMGVKRQTEGMKSAKAASGLLDGAIFALLGLLLAFTFSGAISRFDHRRDLVIEEANAIGTAYLRIDLLPIEAQPMIRELFRQYLDTRIEIYQLLPVDKQEAESALVHAKSLQPRLWQLTVKACQDSGSVPATTLLLAAINEMFDIAEVRAASARLMHTPTVIYVMLYGLALMSSVLAGYAMVDGRKRDWVHIFGFVIIIGSTVYIILDMEYPWRGLIRVDAVNQVLMDVRKGMD